MRIDEVVVCGIGAVTAYGWGMQALWDGLMSQEPAGRVHRGLGDRFPDPCWFARLPDGGDPSISSTRYGRAIVAAANEAIDDAKARGWTPGERVGIVHATAAADAEMIRARYLVPVDDNPRRRFVEQAWTTPSVIVMMMHRFTGPTVITSAACSSGLHALMVAHRLLSCGDASDVIVTAADVGFDGEIMRQFSSLGPLLYDGAPQDVCRPLQVGSRGFVLGEGVATLVLTRADNRSSGYMRLLGSAIGNDAYHPVSIDPSGRIIARTVEDALGRAQLQGAEVEYFVAHATGTEECKAADISALERIGPQARAFGFKPMLGHCMGAAPLLDTVILARAYEERYLPAPSPVAEGHPQLLAGPSEHTGGVSSQLGIGFGGNISVAIFGEAQSLHSLH